MYKNMTKLKISGILALTVLFIITALNYSKATAKIYIENGNVYYACPDGALAAPATLNIDMASVKIIDDNFFTDKNNVYQASTDHHSNVCSFQVLTSAEPYTFKVLNKYYEKDYNNVYSNSFYWGGPWLAKIKNADAGTFVVLGGRYAKDKSNIYYAADQDLIIVSEADANSFEVMSEDGNEYAMDKNNMYLHGEVLSNSGEIITNISLYNSLKGKIILKVQSKGEAYYINPSKKEMHFLSRPIIAFQVMRAQGIGITDSDLEKIPVADNYCPSYTPSCDNPSVHNLNFAKAQNGKIFLQVEKNGEAWYVNPSNSKRYFLGRPSDAFNIMRNLGLGISDADFENLK